MTKEDQAHEHGLGPLAADQLESHPLYPELKALADERQIDLSDSQALKLVLEGLSENEGADARVVFLMGMLLESILHHEERLLMAQSPQENGEPSLDE